MTKILLINPNSSEATLNMMVNIAQGYAGDGVEIIGRAAQGVPSVLVSDADQLLAAPEVVRIGKEMAATGEIAGIIVAAYSDPGMEELEAQVDIPVTGIGKASMVLAAEGSVDGSSKGKRRKFGIATSTPDLIDNLTKKVRRHGYEDCFTGVRVPEGEASYVMSDKSLLEKALEECCLTAFSEDNAEVVIIGGGPLGEVAASLSQRLNKPIIAPIPTAVIHMEYLLGKTAQ